MSPYTEAEMEVLRRQMERINRMDKAERYSDEEIEAMRVTCSLPNSSGYGTMARWLATVDALRADLAEAKRSDEDSVAAFNAGFDASAAGADYDDARSQDWRIGYAWAAYDSLHTSLSLARAEAGRYREALEWYAEHARSLRRYIEAGNMEGAILATLKELELDNGTRAAALHPPGPTSEAGR